MVKGLKKLPYETRLKRLGTGETKIAW